MKWNRLLSCSLLTIGLLIIYLAVSITTPFIFMERAAASSIDKKDVYRGLGIAVLLMVLSQIGQSQEKEPAQIKGSLDVEEKGRDLLAKIIYAEARGEPFEGQVAVGAVVLNRVHSSDFPDSIHGVIFQEGQFSSLDDGQFYLSPNKTAYRAADKALKGKDPSNGALYFYNPRTARTLWWLNSRDKTTEIGEHVFAK